DIIARLSEQVETERGEPEGQPEASNRQLTSLKKTTQELTSETKSCDKNSLTNVDVCLDFVSEDHAIPYPDEEFENYNNTSWEDLQSEVARLRGELAQWKQRAKAKHKKQSGSELESKNVELNKEIQTD
ncbi:unnamed protein product, partial [Protopolystoma xenopodis]